MKEYSDKEFYKLFVSRNWAFISPEEQERIKNTRVLLAGCGLGSNIGVLAVQTGFTKFVVVDHDIVEVSNLNRQAFDRRHIGQNKALALKNILEEKSKVVEVEAYPVKITPQNVEEFVSKADIVVNTVDFDETVYTINDIAREQRKPVFFPINIGWLHGFCLVFTPESAILEDMIGGRVFDDEERFFMNLLQGITNYQIPDYLLKNFNWVMKIRKEKGNPQLGVGVYIVATVIVDSIVRSILRLPVEATPKTMTIIESFSLSRKPVPVVPIVPTKVKTKTA